MPPAKEGREKFNIRKGGRGDVRAANREVVCPNEEARLAECRLVKKSTGGGVRKPGGFAGGGVN